MFRVRHKAEFHLTGRVTLKLEMRVFFIFYKVVSKFYVLNKYKCALKVKVLKSHPVLRVLAGNALPLTVFAAPAYGWTDVTYQPH